MREYLFTPRFHLVGLTAFMALIVFVNQHNTPAWLNFIAGGVLGVLNSLTMWRGK